MNSHRSPDSRLLPSSQPQSWKHNKSSVGESQPSNAFASAIEHTLPGVVIVEDNLHIAFANAAFCEICGYTVGELRGLPREGVKALVHPEDQELVWGRFGKRLRGAPVPAHYQYRGVAKDGSIRWIEMFATAIQYEGKPAVHGAIADITDRKEAEKALATAHSKMEQRVEVCTAKLGRLNVALRESEEASQALLNASTDLAALLDLDGTILALNQSVAEHFGQPAERLVGQCAYTFFSPEASAFRKARAKEAIDSGKTVRFMDSRNGRFYHHSVHPVLAAEGHRSLIALFVRDITEQVRTERELRNLNMMQERIVKLVAHELRSPLTTIKGYADLMLSAHSDPVSPKQRDALKKIKRNVDRLATLAETFLDNRKITAKTLQLDRRSIAIGELLDSAADIHEPAYLQSRLQLEIDAERALEVYVDKDQMIEAFSNIVSNALKFSDQEKVTIKTKQEKGQILVEVTDQGHGISEEDLAHIFEPFYTGSPPFSARGATGTGLGLAFTKAIVEEHGGTIKVKCASETGTTFAVTLPLAKQQPSRSEDA